MFDVLKIILFILWTANCIFLGYIVAEAIVNNKISKIIQDWNKEIDRYDSRKPGFFDGISWVFNEIHKYNL